MITTELHTKVVVFPHLLFFFPPVIFQTFSQLCAFDYGTKSVQIYKAPWYIQDKPRFAYRGLLLGELQSSVEGESQIVFYS